jgi:superfamily I DNA and/or RNA helicase
VTLTRAKHLLIVIGHANTLGSNEVWDDFLTWTEKKNCLYQITSERNAYNDVKDVLNKFSFQQIRRKKHSKLSTDIRKIYAKKAIKIQSS